MLLAWFTGVWWGDVAAGWVAAICLLAFGWGLHGTADRRGGMIDLIGVRPTGELDLDWSDPRPYVRINVDTSRFAQDVEGLRPIGTERTSAA